MPGSFMITVFWSRNEQDCKQSCDLHCVIKVTWSRLLSALSSSGFHWDTTYIVLMVFQAGAGTPAYSLPRRRRCHEVVGLSWHSPWPQDISRRSFLDELTYFEPTLQQINFGWTVTTWKSPVLHFQFRLACQPWPDPTCRGWGWKALTQQRGKRTYPEADHRRQRSHQIPLV